MKSPKPLKPMSEALALSAVNLVLAGTTLASGLNRFTCVVNSARPKSKLSITRPVAPSLMLPSALRYGPPTPTKACTSLAPNSMLLALTPSMRTPSGPLALSSTTAPFWNEKSPCTYTKSAMRSVASLTEAPMSSPVMSSSTGLPPVGSS